jgi:8-amino-7-oxononanoate synthase
MDVFDKCSKILDQTRALRETGNYFFFRKLESPQDAEVIVNGKRVIMAGSNNYLGLTNHPEVIEAACRAARQYGTGAGSAPLLVGTFPITRELEGNLAEFTNTDEVCVFATGYQANVGVISSVAGKGDTVILDRLAHASMVDGAKLSGAQVRVFRHNDPAHLDRVLARRDKTGTALVCVEGIYSMDGDIAPLDEICRVVRKHNAMILVDEAHSTGVLGPGGRGAVAHFGVEDQVDLHLGTMSKALGASGGFVAGGHAAITYIRYFARSGMFSTAPSPMVMAAANAALGVIQAEPERRERLWENCRYMHSNLHQMGFKINDAPSPVIPVVVGSMHALRQMTLELHENDICVNSVPFPAVPHGSERLRVSLTANHTEPQLARALAGIGQAGRNAGVI